MRRDSEKTRQLSSVSNLLSNQDESFRFTLEMQGTSSNPPNPIWRTNSFLNSLNFDTILWTALGEHLLVIPPEEDPSSSLEVRESADGEEERAFDAPGVETTG